MFNSKEGMDRPLNEKDPSKVPVKEENTVAAVCNVMAWLTWVIGIIVEICWAGIWSQSYHYDDIAWIPLVFITPTFVTGLLFCAIGTIIGLLQKIYATMKNDIRERQNNTAKE